MAQKFRNVATGRVIEVADEHIARFDRMARWQRTDAATTDDKPKRCLLYTSDAADE